MGPRTGNRPRRSLLDGALLLRREPRPVGIALGYRGPGPGRSAAALLGEDPIPHLHREAVLEVVDANLTNVLGPGAVAADLDPLESAAGTGLPREHREGRFAYLARLPVRFLGHSDVGIVPEARLANEGKLGILPLLLVIVSLDGGHFYFRFVDWQTSEVSGKNSATRLR